VVLWLRVQALGPKTAVSRPRRSVGCFAAGKLCASTVDVAGLRKEAERRRERAVKKIAKKTLKRVNAADFAGLRDVEASLRLIEGERDALERLANLIDAKDLDVAVELANSLGVGDAPPERPPRGKKKKKGPAPQAGPRLPYNVFRSATGVEIRVGKSASDNDALSCDPAHRDATDWWMHAAGSPGSHVIIRTDDLDSETKKDAACLAALYSKATPPPKGDGDDAAATATGRAGVSLVRARSVTKPPGAKPGLVHIAAAERVETLRVDLAKERLRLERLLHPTTSTTPPREE